MKFSKHKLIIIFILLLATESRFCFSQQNIIDSLKRRINEPLHDTDKINALNALGWNLKFQNPDTSVLLGNQALEILAKLSVTENKTGWKDNIVGNTHNRLGVYYTIKGDFPKSIEAYLIALKIYRQLNNELSIALTLGNIGSAYKYQKNYPKALEFYNEGLEIEKKLDNKSGVASKLSNIADVYYNLFRYKEALENMFYALEIYEASGNQNGIATNLVNIGNVYSDLADSAEVNGSGADELNDKFSNAIAYYLKALKIRETLKDDGEIAIILGNIGSVYTSQKKYQEAEKYLLKALAIDTTIGFLNHTSNTYRELHRLYEDKGDYQKSLQYYKSYSATKDSLFNESKSKDIGKLEAKYEFEKQQEEELRIENEKLKIENEKKERRNLLQYSGIFVFVLLLFVLLSLSMKLSMSEQVAEGLIFFTFLLFFEFCLVLLDPYIETFSSGEPAYKLLFNAVLAGMIFPLHAFFENKLKSRVRKTTHYEP